MDGPPPRFKVTFGNESHPEFIKRALQAPINSDTPIRDIKFTKNEMSGTTKESRGSLFDMICEDELGRVFIVEMQLLNLSSMIHRAKFYAFHQYNKMVKKGNYRFDDLKKIYTISILAGKVYSTGSYHQIGTIRNQHGELMDDQITHVVVELGKFHKTLEEVENDLDKLLYTMKLTDTAPQEVQLPDFMREGWLEETLAELDRANLTPDQRAQWEMTIAGNMTEKYAREEEIEKAKEEVRREAEKVQQQMRLEAEKAQEQIRVDAEAETRRAIIKMIQKGYDLSDIADIMNVPLVQIQIVADKLKEL